MRAETAEDGGYDCSGMDGVIWMRQTGRARRTTLVAGVGAILALTAGAALAAPVCFWASEPVRPGETALLYGDGFGELQGVTVTRLADGASEAEETLPAEVLNPCARSLKAVIPAGLRQGVYRLRVTDAAGGALEVTLNRPKVLWMQGDAGSYGTPGGMLRATKKHRPDPTTVCDTMLADSEPHQLALERQCAQGE